MKPALCAEKAPGNYPDLLTATMPAETKESAAPPVLAICELTVAYRTHSEPIRAVRGASLHIREGETLALVGETGSGKSTVALAILGLLDHQDQSGEIRYKGSGIHSLSLREWRKIRSREIGIVFQDTRNALNPVLTILDHMVETLRAHQAISKKEARRKAMELFREVGIPEGQEKLYPFELSGGTCQRVGIALGLCNKPRLFIADEPTSAIDTAIQAQILDLLRRMKDRYGLALLLISHDLPLISQISDRIAVMYHGRVVESGLKEEVLGAPAHPYTLGLIQCQPSFSHNHEKNRLAAIPGVMPKGNQEFPGCAFAPRCGRAKPRCLESIPTLQQLSKTSSVECCFPLGAES
jgi:peptide/nickel transport system ATP-binding protein